MYLSRVNITNSILNEDFIHFSKHKVKLYAHIKKNTNNHNEFVRAN